MFEMTPNQNWKGNGGSSKAQSFNFFVFRAQCANENDTQ